mgnify:CR=1 FL=1
MKLKILDLFSGLGGFSLGLERTGHFKTVAFCDNDKFSNLVLQKHWKGVKIYNNVKEITKERLEADGIESPDIITGGFPCQPFSVAGKQKGTSDDRHLWPEMFRIIKAFKPRFVIGENVRGIVNIQDGVVFETVCTDLESEGYEVQPFNIPAASVGAPHRRERIWFIAVREDVGNSEYNGSPTSEIGRGNEKINGGTEERQNKSFEFERTSRSEDNGNVSENVANTENGRGQPSQSERWEGTERGSINSRGIEGERKNFSGTEDVANAKSISSDGREIGQHSEESREKRKIGIEVGGVSSDRQKLANTDSERLERLGQSRSQFNETSSSTSRSEERQGQVDQGWWSVEPNVGRVAHGVSGRVHRLKGLGNSIVPQIAEEIGRAIIKAENETQ